MIEIKTTPEKEAEIIEELKSFNPNSTWRRTVGGKRKLKKLTTTSREERLYPNKIPRYVRCYLDALFVKKYSIVFTGRAKSGTGLNMFLEGTEDNLELKFYEGFIDRPSYIHLGSKIEWDELPERVQNVVRSWYTTIWNLKETK